MTLASRLAGLMLTLPFAGTAVAETGTSTGTTLPVSAVARLDFTVTIGRLLFFRVGDAAWPATSSSVSTASFQLTPTTPPATALANNQPIAWNGAAPTFAVTASGNVLPVQVRSNAGPISIRASSSALSHTTTAGLTIPMSDILVTSSDAAGLPAPPIPNAAATGTSVNVAPTGFGSLVTERNASWTFAYANSAARAAGTYTGTVTFTATTP